MNNRIYPAGTDPAGREANHTLLFLGLIASICAISLGICLYQVGATGNPAAAFSAIWLALALTVTSGAWAFLWIEARRG